MNKLRSFFILVAFLLGLGSGVVLHWQFFSNSSHLDHAIVGIRQGEVRFTNPLLECEIDGGLQNKDLEPFKGKINKYVLETNKSDKTSHVSVYFRDLNNGPWIGINEESLFSPASLLKVPVMIAFFKQAEENPELLDYKIEYDPEFLQQMGLSVDEVDTKLEPQKSYSVLELIELMIIDSDNLAFDLLILNIDYQVIEKVNLDLGLVTPNQTTPDDYIDVKSYSSLFRVLYNSSYLSRHFSELALDILHRTSFKDGIMAGVGNGVQVSHKYGVRGQEGVMERQLHDCGIIYYPDHPYLLCVMTKGDNYLDLSKIIKNISNLVFEEISGRY